MSNAAVAVTEHALARRFTISRDSTTTVRLVHLRMDHGGHRAWGECAASEAVTGETVDAAAEALRGAVAGGLDPSDLASLRTGVGGLGPSALAALDLCIYDVAGRIRDEPAHALLGLPAGAKPTTCTVSMDEPDAMAKEAAQWRGAGARRLKLKLGDAALDEARVGAVRAACPDLPLTVDVNEAWSPTDAPRLAGRLAEMGVELIEQPVARDDLDALRDVTDAVDVPVAADEAIRSATDVDHIAAADACTAVNVKVQKVGGMLAARTCIQAAREAGLRVMIGCNLETGLGIAAGAALAGAADWLDLDAHLLLAHDPFGAPWGPGDDIGPTKAPGLGLEPDDEFVAAFEAAAGLDTS